MRREGFIGSLPPGDSPEIGQSYEDQAAPAEEMQLEKAGIRLAAILSEALR